MKKTLIALAALAATGATLAQSSVTITGRMDLGMTSVETTRGAANATPGATDAFSLAGAEGTRTGSRLGFRGTEDLGGGLRAGFTYEIGINADRDTGTNAQTRLANMTLSGGFGTVVVGTFMNAFDTARGFSPATAGVPGGDFVFRDGARVTERFDSRTQNAVAYVSPAFSGFTLSAGAVNEDTTVRNAAGVVTTRNDVQGMILGVNFSQGPLAAQFAYGDLDLTALTPAAGFEVQNWVLGVRYTLPQVVVSFIYEDTQRSVAGISQREQTAWEIGARFPMGAFAPYVTFGQGEIDVPAVGGDRDISAWQIGTIYNLSTRTSIYAAFGEDQSENTAGVNDTKRTGFALGLVHNF